MVALYFALFVVPEGHLRLPPAHFLRATFAEPTRFSALEMAFLVLCIFASGGLFFYRFGPILRTVVRSKKDADFSLNPLGRRVWDFFWEVLCQAKVIEQRPAPGIAHAFVFWGFLAFALVSLNHFAVGMKLGFLPPATIVGRFYFIFGGFMGATRRGFDRGPICAAVFCPSGVAGEEGLL